MVERPLIGVCDKVIDNSSVMGVCNTDWSVFKYTSLITDAWSEIVCAKCVMLSVLVFHPSSQYPYGVCY